MQDFLMRSAAAIAVAAAAWPLAAGRVQAAAGQVFYHDQSGAIHSGVAPAQAAQWASSRLGFTVRLPSSWPKGAALRALWVMEYHVPRFVILYYGGDDGYITCQLHESLGVTRATMNWAPQSAVTIGHVQGTMLRSWIGGANPVVELIWRVHGVRYDLLGSTTTTLRTLMGMATSLQ